MEYKTPLYTAALCAALLSFAGCSSLAYTIEEGDSAGAHKMIDSGTNVNDASDCFTPLMIAAWKGERDLVAKLLEKGADPKIRSKECGYTNTVVGIRTRFKWSRRTVLDDVATAEIARMLIAKGADPRVAGVREFPRSAGWSNGLRHAVSELDLDLLRVLVAAGGPIHQYHNDGKNALLQIASWKKKDPRSARIAAYLRGKGARDLTAGAAQATDKMVFNTYRHIATGSVTTMNMALARRLHASPKNFGPVTFDAGSGKFYHYSEFEWVDNGMNMHKWYVLRRMRTKK